MPNITGPDRLRSVLAAQPLERLARNLAIPHDQNRHGWNLSSRPRSGEDGSKILGENRGGQSEYTEQHGKCQPM
jgi:hypothetical protein